MGGNFKQYFYLIKILAKLIKKNWILMRDLKGIERGGSSKTRMFGENKSFSFFILLNNWVVIYNKGVTNGKNHATLYFHLNRVQNLAIKSNKVCEKWYRIQFLTLNALLLPLGYRYNLIISDI